VIHGKELVEPIVIKLGGSVITIKEKPYTVNHDAIKRLSKIIFTNYSAGKRLVLVHGGGSFGHTAVSEISQRKGILDVIDVAFVQYKMLELATIITKAFIDEGIPVTLYPGHVLCRKSADCNFELLYEDLENGLVPMTYGDIVYGDRGYAIISGDDLAFWISSALGARKIYFVTSKPGVLDKEGQIIRRVTNIDQVSDLGIKGYDVTGGMKKKVHAALEYSSNHDVEIRILDIDGLEKVLGGGEAGSIIVDSQKRLVNRGRRK